MNLTLKILGTASAMPVSDRTPSAQVLAVHGRLFLFDCGEGAQQQFRRARLSFLKTEAVFISHIHGDHVFGLFGILGTMSMLGRTAELHVYGPGALGSILRFHDSFFGEDMGYEVVFHELTCKEPAVIHESRHAVVKAFPLDHKIECYGFRVDALGRSYAYCSDTRPFPELKDWVRGVDLLYHEATYPAEMADKAAARFHSTTVDAATCALEAGVGKLVVGHYSSRYRDISLYERECRSVFPESYAANDGDVFDF